MKKKNRPAIVIETTGRPLRPAERNPERERGPVYPPRSEAEAILAARALPTGTICLGSESCMARMARSRSGRRVALAHSSVERPRALTTPS